MIDVTINTSKSTARVLNAIARLPQVASGVMPPHLLANAILIRIGLAVLGRIKTAFVVKSRGGTDDTGLRWKPLSPHTIAYHRRHPQKSRKGRTLLRRLPAQSKRAAYRPSFALTKRQREKWWRLYRRGVAIYGNHPAGKKRSAAGAWIILKREGARTLMDLYGHAQVEILRDTGLLLNSLTPGIARSNRRPPPVKNQVFRLEPGVVTIGTNRLWAWTHHHGVPGKIPQRRLWPDPRNWPTTWWNDFLTQAQQGVIDILIYLLR
jgi:hypothetical protein